MVDVCGLCIDLWKKNLDFCNLLGRGLHAFISHCFTEFCLHTTLGVRGITSAFWLIMCVQIILCSSHLWCIEVVHVAQLELKHQTGQFQKLCQQNFPLRWTTIKCVMPSRVGDEQESNTDRWGRVGATRRAFAAPPPTLPKSNFPSAHWLKRLGLRDPWEKRRRSTVWPS